MPSVSEQAYQNAFFSFIKEHREIRWFSSEDPRQDFLYRPGQLLVSRRDAERVERALREMEYPVVPGEGFAGLNLYLFPPETDIPGLVRALRDPERWPGQRVPEVQPHHVTVGYPNVMGGPSGPPDPAPDLPDPDPCRADEGRGVTVGIADTGIWADAATAFPRWLGGQYVPETDDVDALYSSGDLLALQGGHGTFIAGVLRQAAQGARFDPEVALDASGFGDERMLSGALVRLAAGRASVINLSLGCFTQDDLPSLPLRNVLDMVDPDKVVVAAAGNAGLNRPSWPAAFPNVVGVAAVIEKRRTHQPAAYSNYGSWVDACAVGEHVSTYVTGRFALPGDPTVRTFQRFARWHGTSFAAPHVAGRIAVLASKNHVPVRQAAAALLSGPRFHPDYGVLVL